AGVPGNLTLHLIEAKDLIANDRGGTSDPYVRVRINKNDQHKTAVIKKTLTPRWMREILVYATLHQPSLLWVLSGWNVPDQDLYTVSTVLRDEQVYIPNLTSSPSPILLQVRDYNTIGKDVTIGEYYLNLWEHIEP
ncbi:6307_t:CDS:2, partial [Racocetra persica]